MHPEFSILICTKNRRDDLLTTLASVRPLLANGVGCTVFDDGSEDGTFEAVRTQFPEIALSRNEVSKGYLFCRNKMLNETQSTYGISLDDDANFATPDALLEIRKHFEQNPTCGVIAFRIFWGLHLPQNLSHSHSPAKVRSFVGCGHAWRISAWKTIPEYPQWFKFYGEEDFASQELFLKGISVDYLPQLLVHHRVDTEKRKLASDRNLRLRRSLAAGWFLVLLHWPISKIPGRLAYSAYSQLRPRLMKADLSALLPLLVAGLDVVRNTFNIIRLRNGFRKQQLQAYSKLQSAKITWKP